MSKKLILPINDSLITAGYKNQLYKHQFGFAHYGFDLVSASGNRTVWACGEGEVAAAGMDGPSAYTKLGNCIVIVYRDVLLPDGTTTDLACRMFHFDSLSVKAGDKVTRDTILGQYGNTGGTTIGGQRMGYHLHIEFDRDVQWPAYAVGIKSSGKVIQRGTVDSTLSPTDCWWLGDGQSIGSKYDGWQEDRDTQLQPIAAVDDTILQLDKLVEVLRTDNQPGWLGEGVQGFCAWLGKRYGLTGIRW